MDHHSSWYNFVPFYNKFHIYLQENFSNTVLFNEGILPKVGIIETVHHVVAEVFIVLILMSLSYIIGKKLKDIDNYIIPSRNITILNVLEVIIDTLLGLMKSIIGKQYKMHVPLVGTLALFILFSNLLGLIPGFLPPTDNLNTTLACGFVVFIYFNYHGFRVHGIGHVTHLANPLGIWWGWFLMPLFLPIEAIGLMIRPISLAMRLSGNMIGDHKVMFEFAGIMPILLPIPFLVLGTLVSVIQTLVFCLLTCVYISLHTKEDAH